MSTLYKTLASYRELVHTLQACGIQVEEPLDQRFPFHAAMHNHTAAVPMLIVSPCSEEEVVETLRLLACLQIYAQMPVSVKSGGHGYFNGASCTGIMLNLGRLNQCQIAENTLTVEPGCILGQVIHHLAQAHKAVPHGDCFGVGAGGHFLTAGWDLVLARRYGLGCQAVIGGRIVLWDGAVVEVNETSHPDLLWAMRGGAAAAVGVVTQIRLRLIDEPPFVTWRLTALDKAALAHCVQHQLFARATTLPTEVSVSFHFHYDPEQAAPVCSFNIFSLWSAAATVACLREYLGDAITDLVADLAGWSEKSLLDFRLLPAADWLLAQPERLGELTMADLHQNPAHYWQLPLVRREMADSYLSTVSSWIQPDCEPMLARLYDAFASIKEHPLRDRMYALVIVGGGKITELAHTCAMPLGEALARFEVHWDDPSTEAAWCQSFIDKIAEIIGAQQDPRPARPYRGDIWLAEQASDAPLDAVLHRYNRRAMAVAG